MNILLKTRNYMKPLTAVIFLLLIIGMPYLQANEMPAVCSISDEAPVCDCCCCSQDSDNETSATGELSGTCCCHIAEEEMPFEIPLEASAQLAQNTQSIPVVAADHPEDLISRGSFNRRWQMPEIDIGHGPPIYISISSLLI